MYNYLVQSRKSDWLAKIPSPTYSTRTGFGLSFSLQSIASYRQTKQRNQIELERLKFQMQSELDKEIQQLEIQIDQLFADADKLKIAIKNFETYENQIHDIEQGKYQNNQSTLKEWLTYKKSYEERKNNLQAERTAIINKLSAMATKTKSPEEFQGLIKIFTNLTF
ncbi:hypothetical protein [Olivibacter sitiensis]|uniref:hypothetical protein n=1 Tax=Olivibacter sitiensis TaxID=376470 RepID=UPI00042A2ACA|nr:hypothetical protein [Olivibacter sitiensis]